MSATFKSALVSLVAAVALAPAALAQTPSEPASVRVAYGDLNMSTRTGGEILLHRIQSAAKKACAKAVEHSPLTPRAMTSCRQDTVAHAVRQMNIATLTAAWGGQTAPTTVASR
jgi:UrcA family protein